MNKKEIEAFFIDNYITTKYIVIDNHRINIGFSKYNNISGTIIRHFEDLFNMRFIKVVWSIQELIFEINK